MSTLIQLLRYSLIVTFFLALAACGGGGGSNEPAPVDSEIEDNNPDTAPPVITMPPDTDSPDPAPEPDTDDNPNPAPESEPDIVDSPAPAPAPGPGTGDNPEPAPEPGPVDNPNPGNGEQNLFTVKCGSCHTPPSIGPDLFDERVKNRWQDKSYSEFRTKVGTMAVADCNAGCLERAATFVWVENWGFSKGTDIVDEEGRGVRAIRLLTPREYQNTVNDLVGVALGEDLLPNRHFEDEFKYPTQSVTGVLLYDDVRAYMALAESVARQADLERLGCRAEGCDSNHIAAVGMRILRRPLDESELSDYQSFNNTYGTRDMLTSMLMSPYFLYRIELGEWDEDAQAYKLNDFEVATALSYQLWGTTPDESLLDAAQKGELSSRENINSRVITMMADDRYGDYFVEFIRYYTKTYAPAFAKPGLSEAVIASMLEEQKAAVHYLLHEGDASIDELFNPGYTFVDSILANHYGMTGVGAGGMTRVETDRNRGGLLHQGIVHVLNSDFAATSLVKRGKMIRENMMCHIMGVPTGVDPSTIDIPDFPITTRERWNYITGPDASGGQCWQCHQLMNEPGSALESFDQAGIYRTQEPAYNDASVTLALDVSGTLRDATGFVELASYGDARELTQSMAGSDVVRDCFVDSYYRFGSGYSADNLVAATIDEWQRQFNNEGNINNLVKTVLASESFIYRLDRE